MNQNLALLGRIWRWSQPLCASRMTRKLPQAAPGKTRGLQSNSPLVESTREEQKVSSERLAEASEKQGKHDAAAAAAAGDSEAKVKKMLGVSKFEPNSDPFGVREMVTVKDLLEARVHFGHKAGTWNREIRPYLYGIRNGIHIFNLNVTLENLHRALNVAGHVAYQSGIILFVNERLQFEALTMQAALRCEEYFVTDWVPGTLSNSFKLLKSLRAPDLMLFFSVPRSKTAVKESLTCGVPAVGVVDSDCDPRSILYPIPGNDDSLQAVKLYSELFCEVILRAKELRVRDEEEARKEIRASAEEKQQLQARKMAALDTELDSIYFGNS